MDNNEERLVRYTDVNMAHFSEKENVISKQSDDGYDSKYYGFYIDREIQSVEDYLKAINNILTPIVKLS